MLKKFKKKNTKEEEMFDALSALEAELIHLEMAGELMMHIVVNQEPQAPYFFARVNEHAERLRQCFNRVWAVKN